MISEQQLKGFSLDLSRALSRQLKESILFYPVSLKKAAYKTVFKEEEDNQVVSILRYKEGIVLSAIPRDVLSQCAAAMFSCESKSFASAEEMTVTERFFSDYIKGFMKTYLESLSFSLEQDQVVSNMSSLHVVYPEDTITTCRLPFEFNGKQGSEILLCVIER